MSIAKIRLKCLRIYFFLSKQTLLFFLMIQKFLEFDLVFEKAWKDQNSTFKRLMYADTKASHLKNPMSSLSICEHSLKSCPYNTQERPKLWQLIRFLHFSQLAKLWNQSIFSDSQSYSQGHDPQTTKHRSSHQSSHQFQRKSGHPFWFRIQSCQWWIFWWARSDLWGWKRLCLSFHTTFLGLYYLKIRNSVAFIY